MTPHKAGNRGTFIIDRRTRVGRIAVASGTTHKPTFKRLNEMITTLDETGRSDILRAIRESELTPLQVYESFRVNELHRLPLGKELLPLEKTMTAWNASAEVGQQRKADNKSAIKRLSAKGSTIADLPAALIAVRADMVIDKHPAMFNRIRATVLAFIRDTLKRSHRLYGEVRDVPLLKERKAPLKQPQNVLQLMAHADTLHEISGRYRNAMWAMALTGMGPKEYFIDGFTVLADRVEIHGAKRQRRMRVVPRVMPGLYLGLTAGRTVSAEREMRVFGEVLWEKCGIHTYDLRRTYANFLEAAGIPRTRRRLYMGHARKDTTDIYEEHEIRPYLAPDARTLEAFLGEASITTPITLVSGGTD